MLDQTRMKKLLLALIVFALLVVTFVFVPFGRAMAEQLAWKPQDEKALDVLAMHYAPEGILLEVHAPSNVTEVWTSANAPLPWRTQHRRLPFHRTPVEDGRLTLLVPYAFSARDEWLLALRSGDGHWLSRSPYFPEAPTGSSEAWAEQCASAERCEPR